MRENKKIVPERRHGEESRTDLKMLTWALELMEEKRMSQGLKVVQC